MLFNFSGLKREIQSTPFASSLLIGVLTLQFGLDYFLSVAALAFCALFYKTKKSNNFVELFLVLFVGLISPFFYLMFVGNIGNFPRDLRVIIGMALVVFLCANRPNYSLENFKGLVPLAALNILLVFVVLQRLLPGVGVFPFLPQWIYFDTGNTTYASNWLAHAAEHGYEMLVPRPSAFYSEPSYLGGVVLFLNFLCLICAEKKNKIVAAVVSVAICILANTSFGIVSNALLCVLWMMRFLKIDLSLLVVSVPLAILLLLILFGVPEIPGGNESFDVRLREPWRLMEHVLFHAPFGVPFSTMRQYFQDRGLIGYFVDAPLQNGLFNLYYIYGWFAVLYLCLVKMAVRSGLVFIFYLLISMQNGAFVDFDKMIMIVFVSHVYAHNFGSFWRDKDRVSKGEVATFVVRGHY